MQEIKSSLVFNKLESVTEFYTSQKNISDYIIDRCKEVRFDYEHKLYKSVIRWKFMLYLTEYLND